MLKTILVQGNLTKKNLSLHYPLGDCDAISSGRWQMAISSISFLFGKDLEWDSIFGVSSNYIDTVISTPFGTEKKEMNLAMVRVKGKPGEKKMLGFKTRDFFEITRPSRNFTLNWTEICDPDIVEPLVPGEKYAYVSVLMLFRRIQ